MKMPCHMSQWHLPHQLHLKFQTKMAHINKKSVDDQNDAADMCQNHIHRVTCIYGAMMCHESFRNSCIGSKITLGCFPLLTMKEKATWWFIPLSKWVITPVTSELTLLIPFITGVITHLLSSMNHQVGRLVSLLLCAETITIFLVV